MAFYPQFTLTKSVR